MIQSKYLGAIALIGLSFPNWVPTVHAALEPMLDLTALDREIDPCNDFYAFSCGGWLSRTQLPADRPSWTRSFSTIHEQNLAELRRLLEAYAKNDFTVPSQYSKLLGDYYAACMNTDDLERTHNDSLSAQLATTEKMKKEDLSRVAAELHLQGRSVLFGIGSTPDSMDSTRMIAEVDQGGLTLPNRDYYFQDEKAPIREKYLVHVAKMLELAGTQKGQAEKDAHSILAFETELAKNALSPVDRRDPQKVYHLLPKGQLKELAPVLAWDSIFETLGAPAFESLNVAVPEFFKGLNVVLTHAPLEQIQAYFRWRIIHSLAPDLSKAFVDENFNFYGRTLSGQKENKPRWKSCVQNADRFLGDALGEAFVRETFGEEGKAQTLAILKTVQTAFEETLGSLSWMDASTREAAVKKLKSIQNKIGYPEKYEDLSSLKIGPESHIANNSEIIRFWTLKDMKKIGQAVDRTKWEMSPPTVNAY